MYAELLLINTEFYVILLLLIALEVLTMVVIEMENGKKIKIELYPDIAPISCENFEKLIELDE